jgi:N-acetylglucosamine malate deacetylase 1
MQKNKTKNILVIAPHPDDEVLGCGALIHRYTSLGNRVYVIVMSRGKPGRYPEEAIKNVREEAKNAHNLLGVEKTIFFDYSAPELDLYSLSDLAGSIASVIRDISPEMLYLPHRGDIHHDHRAVYNGALVAARPTNGCSVKEIYAYETLSETEWSAPFADDAFIPTCFFDVSEQIEKKIEALRCFKSQLREYPSSRSIEAVRALAQYRGVTVGCMYAEAFMHVRSIW